MTEHEKLQKRYDKMLANIGNVNKHNAERFAYYEKNYIKKSEVERIADIVSGSAKKLIDEKFSDNYIHGRKETVKQIFDSYKKDLIRLINKKEIKE